MKHDHGAVYNAPDGLEFTHQPVHEETMSGNVYQCPMKCEGDKTYNAPGNCPVCNMKLVAVDSGKDTHGHSHCHSHGCLLKIYQSWHITLIKQ